MKTHFMPCILTISMLSAGLYGCGGSGSGNEDTSGNEVTTANVAVIDMQIAGSDKYYILSNDNNVYEVDETLNQITKSIPLSNISSPQGFFVDLEGDLFIADTGSDRIIKFSRSSGYQQSLAFGKSGTGNGELQQPMDVVVEAKGEQQKIYVLDAGNNRVQVFNYVGAWLYAFDGSGTATGKLNNPTSMTGYYAQPLTIVDSGNGVIRTLQCSMNQAEYELAVISSGISADLGKVTSNGSLVVADKANSKLAVYQNNALPEYDATTSKPPKIVISRDDLSFLVAYENEGGVAVITRELDPPGTQPVDIAQAFVEALIAGDQDTVRELVGYNQSTIDFIYADQARLDTAIDYYKHITAYSQTYHTTGYATVKAHLVTATEELDAMFELETASPQVVTSRTWHVTQFY